MGNPVRTCVVCRKQVENSHLLRFVQSAKGGLTLDLERRMPGRGSYCHCAVSCLGAKNAVSLLIHSLNRREGKPKALRPELLCEIVDRALESQLSMRKGRRGAILSKEVLESLNKFRTDLTDSASQRVRAKSIRL